MIDGFDILLNIISGIGVLAVISTVWRWIQARYFSCFFCHARHFVPALSYFEDADGTSRRGYRCTECQCANVFDADGQMSDYYDPVKVSSFSPGSARNGRLSPIRNHSSAIPLSPAESRYSLCEVCMDNQTRKLEMLRNYDPPLEGVRLNLGSRNA